MKKILACVLTVVALFACKKQEHAIYNEPQVVFSIVEVDPQDAGKSVSTWDCPVDEEGYLLESAYAEIVINGVTYEPAVYRINGVLYTESIKLDGQPDQATTYTVSKFLLKAENGSIVMANPDKNAEYAEYVEDGVPFQFTIDGFTKVETGVDVICFLPEDYMRYGFDWYSIKEIVVREKCFFGDICVDPADYVGSDYENQSTGLHVDMPSIFQMVVKKDGVEVENSPFTNASDEMGWGVGQSVCCTYPDDLGIEGEEFTFELYILVADGSGGFVYNLYHTFTAIDGGPLDIYDVGNDGVIDFALGDCVFNDPDNPTTDLEIPWNPQAETCETAFAHSATDATCFLDLEEIKTKRWGWTNGPFSEDIKPYHFLIYAGAAKCDVSKGTLVGSLTLDYSDGDATVTYSMGTGYSLDEIHLYVGNEILPRDKNGKFTVAPGQYPVIDENLNGADSYTYTFTGISGDIYVVAHAVVCGVYPD